MPHSRPGLALAFALLAAACRDASGGTNSNVAIAPNTAGINGCSGADQVFTSGQLPVPVALATLVIGVESQLAAAGAGELLYATGVNATVVAIDFAGGPAVETELVGAGTVATLLASAGVAGAPVLSGIAVFDADTLIVAELTSNTLLTVDRTNPDTVGFFAGEPNNVPGFADGLATGTAGRARFNFSEPAQLCPTGDTPPRVFVADPGNHALRVVDGNSVRTIAGRGAALFVDGSLSAGYFDTPTGVVATCDGRLLVSERGANGFGNRLRVLAIGASSPFGGFFGSVTTFAGDGTNATTAGPSTTGAQLARPVAPFVSATGEVYWIDQDTGVLRRRLADGTCDCPLHVDCADAVTTPDFTPFHAFSLAQTAGGKLYVLDATTGSLVRVTP